jgi:hypothetical protein
MGIWVYINERYGGRTIKLDQDWYWSLIAETGMDDPKKSLLFFKTYMDRDPSPEIQWIIDNWEDDLIDMVC